MQLQQLRYVLEIDRTKSISKAAENLFLTQPNLSSAVSDLEKKLGIKLFTRTNRGVCTTDEGLIFISYARTIVDQMTNLERMYEDYSKNTATLRYAWSAATAYIPCAFINRLPGDSPANIHLIEGSHLDVIKSVLSREADIGAIYIPENHMGEYERMALRHNLALKKMWKVKAHIVTSADSQLARADIIKTNNIPGDSIQLVYRPAGIFDLPNSAAPKSRGIQKMERNIYFSDKGTLLEVLATCPNTYIQAIDIDPGILKKLHLAVRPHTFFDALFVRLLLYPKQPLSKEVKWLIDYHEKLSNPAHPHWAEGIAPIPIDTD